MVHPIKELFQINVDHNAKAFPSILLCLEHSIMSTPAWAEAIAEI